MPPNLFEHYLPVEKAQLSQWYRQSVGIEVSVVGDGQGEFAITAFNKDKNRFILCDGQGNRPVIINPDYLSKLLEEMAINHYTVDVSMWDATRVFDRHAWATKYRQKKNQAGSA